MDLGEATERDRRLLAQMIDGLPKSVPPEQHRGDIASLLAFFERLHAEHAAEPPGWLRLGQRLYTSGARTGDPLSPDQNAR
jgi:hypothetical protein